jgi:hypothetical protein
MVVSIEVFGIEKSMILFVSRHRLLQEMKYPGPLCSPVELAKKWPAGSYMYEIITKFVIALRRFSVHARPI